MAENEVPSQNWQSVRISGLSSRQWRHLQRYLISYSMISPFYILFAIFGFIPLVFSLYISFQRWNLLTPMVFNGFANYTHLLTQDKLFRTAAYNTAYIGILASLGVGIGALVLAFILNSPRTKFRDFYRAAYFLPVLASSVAVGIIFSQLFSTRFGLVNSFLQMIGLPRVEWLAGSGQWLKLVIILLNIWRYTGWNMVLLTAGLQSISRELYEAAEIDGANQFHLFKDITIPLLRPTMLYVLITMISGSIQMFDEAFIIAGDMGGPSNQGLTLGMYMYANGFSFMKLGYASALGYIMAILIFVLSFISLKVFGKSYAA